MRRREEADEDGERIPQVRASIEASRQQIAESLRDIQTNVEESIDWRSRVKDNPWQAVGIAFGFGFYLGFR